MSNDQCVIMWFRRDLRLKDNIALFDAAQNAAPVVPVFVLDPNILHSTNTAAPRVKFLLSTLRSLDAHLQHYGSRLLVRHGDPSTEMPELIDELNATAVFANHDYTPYAKKRDGALVEKLRIPFHRTHDAVLHAPGEVLKKDGEPYVVFTPFKKQWLQLSRRETATGYLSEALFADYDTELSDGIPSLNELGFDDTFDLPAASEDAAHQHLSDFMDGNIFHYGEARNRLVAEPWNYDEPGSSYLSPYLRLGVLSPRQVYWAAREAYVQAPDDASRESVQDYVNELVWRDFYVHILDFFPHVASGSFREEYDAMEWDDNDDGLQAWKDGMTGYPIVDAAMRQLKQIGWMPNRARMIVASFLTKDLLIDWREGERHFMQYLIDGDPAANNGGWQWAAGTGTDAQPYFRIFNPVSQSKKFDPDGEYIRHWIPELRDVDNKHIHAPWELDEPPADYPAPIVNHKEARERTLAAYKALKD